MRDIGGYNKKGHQWNGDWHKNGSDGLIGGKTEV
jgi:hypothetical protein